MTFRGFEYKSLINGNIFDNPEISCYWTRLDKKGDFILDRIEKTQNGKIVAVFEGDNALYNITEANMPNEFINSLEVGMIIEAEIVENKLISPKFLYEETDSYSCDISGAGIFVPAAITAKSQ